MLDELQPNAACLSYPQCWYNRLFCSFCISYLAAWSLLTDKHQFISFHTDKSPRVSKQKTDLHSQIWGFAPPTKDIVSPSTQITVSVMKSLILLHSACRTDLISRCSREKTQCLHLGDQTDKVSYAPILRETHGHILSLSQARLHVPKGCQATLIKSCNTSNHSDVNKWSLLGLMPHIQSWSSWRVAGWGLLWFWKVITNFHLKYSCNVKSDKL